VHAGVVAATTPIVAVIDADGSMDPADLPRLVAALQEGADLAIGRRRPDSASAARRVKGNADMTQTLLGPPTRGSVRPAGYI